jgi:hypothetical protein
VERGYPGRDHKAYLELVAVQGFRQVVVGAGLHTFEAVCLVAQGSEEDEEGVAIPRARLVPDLLAQGGAIEPGHHPVTDDHVYFRRFLVYLPGFDPVGGGDALVAQSLDGTPQDHTGNRIVLGDEYSQSTPPS